MTWEDVPLVPDKAYVSIIMGSLRTLMAGLSALGIGVGAWSDEKLLLVASVLVFVGTWAWSVYQKIMAAKRKHDALVATAQVSAKEGTPVVVVSK